MVVDLLVQIIFGWPFIITSLLVSAAGLITKRHQYLFIAAALFLPFSLYLSGYPVVRGLSFALPLCLIGSAMAIRNQKMAIAWLLLLPPLIVSAWLAVIVLNQKI